MIVASRKLSNNERYLLRQLLSIESEHYQGLEELHLAECLVHEIDADGSLKFIGREQEGTQVKLPVEAQFEDQDGMWVHALLFRRGNKIDELEIYKDDGTPVQRWPNPKDWQILVLP